MADSTIYQLPLELSTLPVAGDLLVVVDISDTTDSVNGTTKKITFANLMSFAAPTSEPANESDLSVLPGGVTPSFGFRFAPRASGGFWMIFAGDSIWKAYVPIN